jgi:hypothetical protein
MITEDQSEVVDPGPVSWRRIDTARPLPQGLRGVEQLLRGRLGDDVVRGVRLMTSAL